MYIIAKRPRIFQTRRGRTPLFHNSMSVGAAAALGVFPCLFFLCGAARAPRVSFSGQKGQHMEDCVKFSLCARAAEYQLQEEITLFSLAHSFFFEQKEERERK